MFSATACPDNSGKSCLTGKTIIYFIMILALFTSCKEEEVKTQGQKQKVPEEQTSKILNIDSVTTNDFGEHKSIHQIEWEEHQNNVGADTQKSPIN